MLEIARYVIGYRGLTTIYLFVNLSLRPALYLAFKHVYDV